MMLSKLTAFALCVASALGSPIWSSTEAKMHNVSTRGQLGDLFQRAKFQNVTHLQKRGKKHGRHNLCEDAVRGDHRTCITLTNATPYRWRKGFSHDYQMQGWDKWSEFIEPGETFCNAVGHGRGYYRQDTAGEVAYHLEGTEHPMSFMVEFRKGHSHHIWIRFMEELETGTLSKETELKLGFRSAPDGQYFLLAGKEGDFISNNGPDGWMQSMMDDIGDVPLSEIVLGRTHHTASYHSENFGLAVKEVAQCQTTHIHEQLREGGVRVMDMRLAKWEKDNGPPKYIEVHGVTILGKWHGVKSASYDEMIEAINEFNDEVPGELIIFDVHEAAFSYYEEEWFEHEKDPLTKRERADFYKYLKKLKHRINLPETDDYTKLPVKDFIGNGKSAVIIRIDQSWLDMDGEATFPGPSEGFVTSANFPLTSTWSDTNNVHHLRKQQLSRLREHRAGPTDAERKPRKLYDMQWLLTLQNLQNVLPAVSTVDMNREEAWPSLFQHGWTAFTEDYYPSWITVDAVRGGEFKSLIMAMNKCLVARSCGDWAEKERST